MSETLLCEHPWSKIEITQVMNGTVTMMLYVYCNGCEQEIRDKSRLHRSSLQMPKE